MKFKKIKYFYNKIKFVYIINILRKVKQQINL